MARSDKRRHSLFAGFSSDLERMIEEFFVDGPTSLAREGLWSPPTDVYDAGESVIVRMEIPGVRPEDVDVTVVDDRLILRGRRRESETPCRTCYQQMEIHYGAFLRIIPLAFPFDGEEIEATYHDGFLSVTVPRLETRPTEVRSVRILVRTGGES